MVKILRWLKKFFSLFYDAILNCWSQLWKSFVILVVLTVILATVFYIYEAPMQPEYGNWFKDLLWAFFFYIGDPGSFGGNGPVTFAGRVIASILSILNILIFAVPAGIIASGFTSALEAEAEEKKLATYCAKIRKVFKPIQCRHYGCTSLKKVVIPEYVKHIGSDAFCGIGPIMMTRYKNKN